MPPRKKGAPLTATPAQLKELMSKWAEYIDNPVKFAYEVVCIERLDKWQEETLMALATIPRAQVAVAAGTGVGKEVIASLSLLWFLCTRPGARVAAMSASAHQVEVALWFEIQKWIDHSPYLGFFVEWTPSKIKMKENPDGWFAFQSIAAKRVSSKTGERDAEGGAGIHGKHLLLIISEASGVDDVHIDAKLATLTDAGDDQRVLVIGNPVRRSGRFYEFFSKEEVKKSWWTRNVSHAESSFVSKAVGQRLIDLNGEDSPIVQAKVMGQFPTGSEGRNVFSYDEIIAAFNRNVEDDPDQALHVGVDVARYGDDETVIAVVRNHFGMPLKRYKKLSTMETAIATVQEITRWWRRPADNPRPKTAVLTPDDFIKCQREVFIKVDETGVGGGVVDALRSQGWIVFGINNASTPRNKRHYRSRGDEIWMVDGKIGLSRSYIPHDDDLLHQLCNREVEFDLNGKRKLESKEHMKTKGLPSPDMADALMLALAVVVDIRNFDYSKTVVYT